MRCDHFHTESMLGLSDLYCFHFAIHILDYIAELYFSVILIWKYDQDDQNPHLFSYDDGDDEVVRGRLLEGSC